MSLFRTIGAAALLAAAAGPAFAQRKIGFDEAIKRALESNVAVRQAANAASLGDATVKQQQLQRLPDLRLSVSGAENVGRTFNQTEGTIVDQQTQSLGTGLSSSFTLFDGGKTTAAVRGAQASANASDQDFVRAKQTAVFTVASSFVTLANQREQLAVQQENLAAQQEQLSVIQKFVDAGTRPAADLYQQQATTASAKLAVAQAKRAVELANVDLIDALQLDPAGTFDFGAPPTVNAAERPSYNLDSLIARAYAARTDLSAERSRMDAASQDVKAAAATKLPTISITGSYSSAYNTASALSLSDQLNQRRGGALGLGVSIPLFDRGSSSVAEQRARIAEDNSKLALDKTRQQIGLEVRRAYLDEASAREQLVAAQSQLDAATQAVDMAQRRYEAGASTLLEVTQARAQRVQAASAVATARNNLALQQTVMSYYTGALDLGSM